jgi:DNA-binding GntR family transcriptional regulator
MASGSGAEQERLNHAFHALVNRAGGSRRLASVIGVLSGSIPPGFFAATTGWKDEACAHHAEILAALQVRDGAAAADAVIRHLAVAGACAVQMLEAAGFWSANATDRG